MEDLNDKTTGDSLTATEWNQIPSEIQNVIEESGIVLTSGDVAQQLQSIYNIVRRGLLFVDSGVVNSYILTSAQSQDATQYRDGMLVIFDSLNDNTGASVININGLGSQTITESYGSLIALSGGEITGLVTLIYDGVNFSIYKTGTDANAVYDNNTYAQFRNAADNLDLDTFGLDSSDQTRIRCNNAALITDQCSSISILNTSSNNMFDVSESGATLLSYNSATTLRTADTASASNSSGASVLDVGGTDRSVGFNVMPSINFTASGALTRSLGGYLSVVTSGIGISLTLDTDANLPIGYTAMISNISTADINLVLPVGTLRYLDGTGVLNSGDRILAVSSICTISKLDDLLYVIYGNGIT